MQGGRPSVTSRDNNKPERDAGTNMTGEGGHSSVQIRGLVSIVRLRSIRSRSEEVKVRVRKNRVRQSQSQRT